MKKNKIFIACDTTKISKIKEIIKKTQTTKLKIGYKLRMRQLTNLWKIVTIMPMVQGL